MLVSILQGMGAAFKGRGARSNMSNNGRHKWNYQNLAWAECKKCGLLMRFKYNNNEEFSVDCGENWFRFLGGHRPPCERKG